MQISCRDIQKQFRQMLSGLLVILLALVPLVRAHGYQSQALPPDQKQIASKAGDKEPRPALPNGVGSEEDAKLAVYQVHRLAEKILDLRSVRARAVELARLASALWKHDEPHARSLFEKALNMTTANGSDREAGALSFLHRRVIALVARNDSEWAKRLIDTAAKREADDQGSKTAGDANITTALDLVALLLSALLVKKFFFDPAQQSPNYQLSTNSSLRIKGINWADSDRTVLLALSKDCKYCSQSAEFYRRLAANLVGENRTRLIAVFPERQQEAGEAYLKELNVPIREVRYVSLPSLGINSVPTLAILDQNGVVTDMWGGKFSPLEERDLMSKLGLEDTRSPDEWSITEANLERKVANKEQLVLLDIRERAAYALNHKDGSRNIPLDELRVRAQNELSLDHTIVVYGSDPSETDLAYSILDSQGFARVLILRQNATHATKQSP